MGGKAPGLSNKYIEGKEKKRKKEICGVNKTLKRSIKKKKVSTSCNGRL